MTAKVLIGIPARDWVLTGFAHSLATLVGVSAAAGLEVKLTTSAGTLICDQRAKLAQAAVDEGFDYLLFADSDMRFPGDALLRMLARGEAVVTCNYTTRRPPAEPVAFRKIATGEKLYTEEVSTGLEECAANGLGLALIATEVFRAMDRPWFYIPYIPDCDGHWGEDVWFCNAARKAGYPVWVDHDLSKDVRHTGLRDYDFLDALAMRGEGAFQPLIPAKAGIQVVERKPRKA